jgi:hypothetical protein
MALDWRDPRHWRKSASPCSYCGGRTNLRDEEGRAAHKVCAELAGDAAPAVGLDHARGAAAARAAIRPTRDVPTGGHL